ASNPLQHLIGDEGLGMFYDRAIAERVEEVARQMEPENLPSAIKALDAVTTAWKKITLTHPSWVITDLVGNLFNGMAGGVRPDAYVRHGPQAMKIVTLLSSGAGTGALRRLVVRVNGQTMTGDELARVMIENGVVGQNFARSEVLDHGARGILSAAEVGRRSVPVGVNSVEELRKLANRRAPILRSR